MYSDLAAEKIADFFKNKKEKTLLDIGCGRGEHAKFFISKGFKVHGCDFPAEQPFTHPSFKYRDMNYEYDRFLHRFDVVWASHVLEHTRNPHNFLVNVVRSTNAGGLISITVPPLKHQIVGGHINLFNAGIVLYRLILAGVDCSGARVKEYGYNISVLVHNLCNANLDDKLHLLNYDCGDIETLSDFFPKGFDYQGFNGDIKSLNWD